jgi:dTDP-4-amino-4,6-dideoxygalactose transaminase
MALHSEIVEKRRRNLLHFLERARRFAPYIETFREEPGEKIGPQAIPFWLGEAASFTREQLAKHLEENGVETRTLFQAMPTQCRAFRHLGRRLGEFPEAEYIGRRGLHIGVHQELGLEDIDYVIDIIRGFLARFQG